jgi:hypothetical protein
MNGADLLGCCHHNFTEDQWQTVVRTDQDPMREYSVSYQNLMPSSSCTFRIVAEIFSASYTKFGISKSRGKPFQSNGCFVCQELKSKSYKYKRNIFEKSFI